MARIHPKEVFREAKSEEAKGNTTTAAAAYTKLGAYFLHKNMLKEARMALERAVKLKPTLARAHLYLAICGERTGDKGLSELSMIQFTREALKSGKVEEYAHRVEELLAPYAELRKGFYEAVLTLDRTTAKPFLALAKACLDAADLMRAQQALLDGLKTRSDDTEVVEMLKQLLSDMKRDAEITHIERFENGKLERNDLIALLEGQTPQAPEPSRSLVAIEEEDLNPKTLSMLITEVERELGANDAAEYDTVAPLLKEFRERANPILSSDAKARMDMALAFFEMGLYREAEEELRAVRENDSRYWEAQALLGQVYVVQSSDLAALEVFQSCLRHEDLSESLGHECQYQLANIYLRLGDFKQALEYAKHLNRECPDYRDLKSLKEQLKEKLGWDPFALSANSPLAKKTAERKR